MTTIDPTAPAEDGDLTAADVAWDIDTILDAHSVDDLFDEADVLAHELTSLRGTVAELDADGLVAAMRTMERIGELTSRAGHYVMLAFSTDTADPERGAAMAAMQERSTAINTTLIFFDLEWAALAV